MQFPAMDDEDGDFLAAGSSRSRLSSLFQSEGATAASDVNQALTFTAPKQPRKGDNVQGAAGALKLLHAVVVHAYKLKDGNYSNQGKLGCAILGHRESCSYKLLLYKGKQIQVTIATITPSFIFHVQPNNYANFYDEKKENWSINFDSEAVLLDFTKQIAVAKANAQGKSVTTLVMQDLIHGEGQPLENGDTAEVKYTGWLLSNFTFGQVFDSNMTSESSYKVRLGKSKVIKGWHEGLLGMQKGGKRLLIIPSDLAYGAEGMSSVIPPNSSLIFEIHVMKIKIGHESSHSPSPIKVSDPPAEKKPDVPPRQSFSSQEDIIKSRGASLSEQLSQSPKRDKAQLISRMAKMGMATLPFQGAIAAQVSSDSESEVDAPQPSSPAPQNISRTSSPKSLPKSRSRTNSGPVVTSQPVPPQPAQVTMPFHVTQPPSQVSIYDQTAIPSQPPLCAATPFTNYSPQLPGQYSLPQSPFSMQNVSGFVPSVTTSVVDSHLPLLITETRNQNTEVRISLSKISDKVESILHKVDDLRLQGRTPTTSMPYMESAILLQNLERIIQENTLLKEDIEVKNSKIQSLNEKICDLFQRNQRFFEESNSMLEQRSDSIHAASAQSQEKILTLEQEKARLQLELSTSTIKLSTLEADLAKYQKLENELQQKLLDAEKEARKQESLLKDVKESLNEDQSQLNSLKEKVRTLEEEKSQLITKIKSLEQEQSNIQESADLVEKYKIEIQQYKEKIEQMNVSVNDSTTSARQEEENIRLQLTETVRVKEELEMKIKEMQKKLNSNEELRTAYEEKLKNLETEVANSQMVKKKFEVFQEKTRAMKERYENQIIELMNEVKHLQSVKAVGTSPEFSAEIKKVMNILYKHLQGKFSSDETYSGSKVLETVLQTIMGLTLKIIEKKNQSSEETVSSAEESKKELENEHVPVPSGSNESEKKELIQQNGIVESKVDETAPSKELFSNSESLDTQQSEDPSRTQLDDSAKSKDEALNENISESTVNTEEKVNSKSEEKTNVQETIKRESPETNLQPPSSNLFSELLSDSDGSKIWRPQPPPLFDDDDEDDEDDDDWLK